MKRTEQQESKPIDLQVVDATRMSELRRLLLEFASLTELQLIAGWVNEELQRRRRKARVLIDEVR